MKLKTICSFLVLILIISLTGCTVEEGSIATTNENVEDSTNIDGVANEDSGDLDLLSTAISADLDTSSPKNWDADAENDGVIIYPTLNDKNGNTVQFENVVLDVDIEIWDTIFDDNYNQVKNNKIYTGQGTIDSWKDGNFMYDGGIKVAFDEMNEPDTTFDYGYILIKIHLPDGRVLEALSDPSNDMGVRIR
ncbi:MAG: hypothetical protein AB7V77_01665 [Candidatus Woesearchaeota archaeon]